MSRTWYGSLQNRLEEGHQFVEEIKVGTGVTEYYYSDREPYEVIEVSDQKHFTMRKMDHRHVGDCFMDNNWELVSNEENPCYDVVKRGKNWYFVSTITADQIQNIDAETEIRIVLAGFDLQTIREKGKQSKYRKANISIGHAEYYYDYEF